MPRTPQQYVLLGTHNDVLATHTREGSCALVYLAEDELFRDEILSPADTDKFSTSLVRVNASTAVARVLTERLECYAHMRQAVTLVSARTREYRMLAELFPLDRYAGLLRNKEHYRYDPYDGTPLTYSADGTQAQSKRGHCVFPRLDPAVIGIVELVGQEKILLAENALRRGYFSLIAGYVEHGETLEQAFRREVYEETGRRVEEKSVRYIQSQPWPLSGSLMMGMYALTYDEEPYGTPDHELSDIRWVSRKDIVEEVLPLPAPGSLAYTLIRSWAYTPHEIHVKHTHTTQGEKA